MALLGLSMFSYCDKSNPIKRNKNGFTITEVIISALLIAILTAGLFGAFIGTKQLINRARHKMQAYNFAVEALDKLRSNYKYNDTAMDVTPPIHTDTDIGGGILQGELASLSATLTYDVTEPQVNGYKEVIIHVHWNEPVF